MDVNTVDKMKADVKKAVDAAERRHLVRTKTHSGAMMADPELVVSMLGDVFPTSNI